MKVVPLKNRPVEDPDSDEWTREDYARLAEFFDLTPFGYFGTGLSPGKAKPMSEFVLANRIEQLLEEDAEEWPPLYHRPRLKDIVRIMREAGNEPLDLVGLLSLLEWQDLLAPLEVIKRILEEGLREGGPLERTPDGLYVLKPRGRHAGRSVS